LTNFLLRVFSPSCAADPLFSGFQKILTQKKTPTLPLFFTAMIDYQDPNVNSANKETGSHMLGGTLSCAVICSAKLAFPWAMVN
jgi:hypothetical protein